MKKDLIWLDSNVTKLIHYSTTKGLATLDPQYQGTGVSGVETKYGIPEIRTIYFYVEEKIHTPLSERYALESGSIAKYYAHLLPEQKLYDISTDPEQLYQKLKESGATINKGIVRRDEFFEAIRDFGYYGIFNSRHYSLSDVVAIFYPHPVIEDINFVPQKSKQLI